MTEMKIYQLHTEVCKALGHSIRIEIIDLLGKNEMDFSEIGEKSGVAKSSL